MSPTTYVQDGTLFVNDAKLGDGGTYICTGKNALNIDRAIVSLHVGGETCTEAWPLYTGGQKELLTCGADSNLVCGR